MEDDFFQAVILDKTQTSQYYNVIAKAKSVEEAIQLASEFKSDLIFTDILLDGEMDRITPAMRIQEELPIPLIYNTGNSDQNHQKRAEEADYLAYLIKPITREIIVKTTGNLEKIG